MKATIVTLACALSLHLAAGDARATSITLAAGDSYYVGAIARAGPSNPASELSYVAYLIGLEAGATSGAALTPFRTSAVFTRAGSSLSDSLPAPGSLGVRNDKGPLDAPIQVGGAVYIVAKYSTSTLVWLVRDIGPADTVVLPQTRDRRAISHYTAFTTYTMVGATPDYRAVPDGGVTLLLLAAALVGLRAFR